MFDPSAVTEETKSSMMRRLTRRAPELQRERCDLCGEALPSEHRHLLQISSRQISCVCRACALLFYTPAAGAGSRRIIPEQTKLLAGFDLTDGEWAGLRLPVNMAFFFHSTLSNGVMALYPSPAGATESMLESENWQELVERNPILKAMEPDVEALLVNRVRDARQYFLTPIDECYKLVGLIRMKWRGLGGGTLVWEEINLFFEGLAARSKIVGKVDV